MNQLAELTVAAEYAGYRLDHYLTAQFPDFSRAYLQRLLADGRVLRNAVVGRKSMVLASGDHLQLDWPRELPLTVQRENIPFTILHEEDDFLVINKPAGLTVHPASNQLTGTLVNALLGYDYLHFSAMLDERQRPGIVHRLDKQTSGALVVARLPQSRAALSAAFKERLTDKVYLALVLGRPATDSGTIDAPIGRHPRHRERMSVLLHSGKSARSHWRVLASGQLGEHLVSLIELKIESGRTHQIRVHLKHLGYPVLGDELYGNKVATHLAGRQMLHAWKLGFPHPSTGAQQRFTAPLPDDFLAVLAAAGLPTPT